MYFFHVTSHVPNLVKWFRTYFTMIWFFPTMKPSMNFKTRLCCEFFATLLTREGPPMVVISALWAKLLRKWEIGKFNKITSWPLIFWKLLLFQMNLEENVTFTFYFFSFASNFPCKILWDNKNIDANIFIFSNSIFTMKGVRSKKVILRFFLKHKKI